jgi:hypothetical protein
VPGTALAPTTVGGGVGYTFQGVAIEAGGLADFTTFKSTTGRFMLGGEYFLMDRIPLRGGYRFDTGTQAHAVSLGLGYVDRKWSIEIGGRRDVVAEHPMTKVVLALRFFYDSGGGGQQMETEF